jgi:3-dehydroquinate dehydratase-2
MKRSVLVVLGANLELLGKREPEIYGTTSLEEIRQAISTRARARDIQLSWISSNHEGELVDALNESMGRIDGVLINPGAFTHTSVAIRDAISALGVPVVEVHLSNLFAREEFRRRSMISEVVTGVVSGLGARGMVHAFDALVDLIQGTPLSHIQETRESSRDLRAPAGSEEEWTKPSSSG